MILTSTTQTLEIDLLAAVTTNQLQVTVDYVDFTSTTTTPGVQASASNSTTAVTILSAPASSTQRKVNLVTVCNRDTAPAQVSVSINDNSTLYPVVQNLVLAVGSTLQFTDTRGWFEIDAAGNYCTAISATYSNVAIYTANDTYAVPANVG